MVSSGQVSHKEIWAMLNACAPGWTKEESEHYYRVMWKGRTYSALSKGQHGKKKGQGLVEVGHIRQLVRQLRVDMTCAKKHLPILNS